VKTGIQPDTLAVDGKEFGATRTHLNARHLDPGFRRDERK
jgi:hypothetical protein